MQAGQASLTNTASHVVFSCLIAKRQGLGRMIHVHVRDLALQQWIADGRLTLQKVAISANAANFFANISPSSRNLVFYCNQETKRLLECCIGMGSMHDSASGASPSLDGGVSNN